MSCNATGDNYELVECEFGCSVGGCIKCDSPECEKRIVPRYASTSCNELSGGTLTISENGTLDTSSDPRCIVVPQTNGPELCLLKYKSIVLETNQTLKVRGLRALALVADYALEIKGTLDVSADGTTNGPGGGIVKSGDMSSGYPGAGYRHQGGHSGSIGVTNGGMPKPSPIAVTDLFGGTQVAPMAGNYGMPGGAGGAVTAVSCRGKLSVSGVIDAGGGGGSAAYLTIVGNPGQTVAFSPSGGGSGGTVVLQGLQVHVTGQLFANGGGGGGNGGNGPDNGQDGSRSTTAALGGAGAGGGRGGNGGTSAVPGVGVLDGSVGGGGGSAGFIVVYSPAFIEPVVSPVVVSPALEPGQVIPTN